ncbi:flagellar filament outer layer protein FlaA [Marispirochaeta aestuarii]|uniref:flagellar filament outer layer protein FlaA n=1 Tax=Marispirochaeta aestuarii TaxID=1963862 RepID=UPI0029C768C9|nr:flagellar filament outer layer protein FlaA [Marispirochaeta aestuarii]
MKRFAILLCLLMVVSGMTISAEESVLIDFASLTADTETGENEATMVDFSDKAGTSFSDEEKERMKTSLAIDNWDVQLSSSSRTVANQRYSMTREAPVKDTARRYAGETIMGIRVHFPLESYNSYAVVKPPFEIPAYYTPEEPEKFNNFGVLKNVGVIKSISMNVLGKNYPHRIGLILKDQNNMEQTIILNNLEFDGWKTLTWNNPNYIEEVRNREIQKFPLYPKTAPNFKLIGILIFRDAMHEGGDFVTYVKDVSMTYDLAVLSLESDVNDEEIWGILEQREEARRTAEFERLGNIQVLRYLEAQKMHQEPAEAEE